MTSSTKHQQPTGDQSNPMPSHTPGPWHASRKSVYVNDMRNTVVAELIQRPGREANALLIAAAPDMLAALKLAEAALVDGVRVTLTGYDPEKIDEAIANPSSDGVLYVVRAAIAQAEGK